MFETVFRNLFFSSPSFPTLCGADTSPPNSVTRLRRSRSSVLSLLSHVVLLLWIPTRPLLTLVPTSFVLKGIWLLPELFGIATDPLLPIKTGRSKRKYVLRSTIFCHPRISVLKLVFLWCTSFLLSPSCSQLLDSGDVGAPRTFSVPS